MCVMIEDGVCTGMMHLCSRTLDIYAVMMEADREWGARRGTGLATASGYVSDVQQRRQKFTYANISSCGVHLRAGEDGRVHHRVRYGGRERVYREAACPEVDKGKVLRTRSRHISMHSPRVEECSCMGAWIGGIYCSLQDLEIYVHEPCLTRKHTHCTDLFVVLSINVRQNAYF